MATKKLYQCLKPSCQAKDKGVFYSDVWKCPQCGLKHTDPKFGHRLTRKTLVHYDPPTEHPGIGENHRACAPGKPIQAEQLGGGVPNPYHAGTANPGAVNCPECKKTAVYLQAVGMTDEEEGASLTKAALERLEPLRTH